MNTYQHLSLAQLEPDPSQPRRAIDDAKLAELAASIKVHGIIVPIGVRPHPSKNHGTMMIVKGERRWRAAAIAGLTEVPVIVEDLTDQQALEHQLVENSQREDVHPLDEADAYKRLLDQCDVSMDDLVAKSGKSRAHLYGRLKLLDLAPGPYRAFLDGRLTASVAELIARIPSAPLQEQATKEVLGEGEWKDYEASPVQPETIGEGRASDAHTQPLSFRAARALILKKYSTRLSLAKFSTSDADLVPSAGACTTCPHRSGNQPELALPGVEKVADDICTNPPCFEAKTEAVWKQAAAEAKARGLDVIDGKKAAALWVWNGELQPSAPYVDMDTRLPCDLDPTGDSGRTFGKLLGNKAADVERVMAKGPDGAPRELMVKVDAVKALREAGKLEKPSARAEGGKATTKEPASREDREAAKKAKERADEKERITEAAMTATLGIIAKGAADVEPGSKADAALWKWLARVLLDRLDPDDEGLMLARRGLDKREDLAELPLKSVGDARSLVVEFLVCAVSTAKTSGFATKETKELFDEVGRLFKVDFAEQLDVARDAMKAAKKAEAEAADAKAKKGARK